MDINRHSYEEFFLLYVDNELSESDRRIVEEFIEEHPDLKQELALLSASVFIAENDMVFENKEVLFRKEDNFKFILFRWSAAAAILILALGTVIWFNMKESGEAESPSVAKVNITPLSPKIPEQKKPAQVITIPPEPLFKKSVVDNRYKPTEKHPGNKRQQILVGKPKQPSRKVTIVASDSNASMQPLENSIAKSIDADQIIVASTGKTENIAIEVKPRELHKENVYLINNSKPFATAFYDESPEDNFIYFANTALPKNNKFRGVFRKAVRIIDKVTSRQ